MSWELIGGLAAIIGVVYLVYQNHILPHKENQDAKIGLLTLFGTSQTLITNLINDIESYAQENKCFDAPFFQGSSFNGYLAYLRDLKEQGLSEKVRKMILTEQLPTDVITSMVHSLNNQILSFNNTYAYFNTNFKYR
jgi:hypothetical protein